MATQSGKGTLKYRKTQRTPQVGKDAGTTKWYATAVQDRTLDFEDFVTHISEHNSPFSRGTIHGVLMDMLDCLKELVLDGKNVRLGDLGLFAIGMTSRGEATKDKVNANSITGVHLLVRNTKTWSNSELRTQCKLSCIDGSSDTSDSTSEPSDKSDTTDKSEQGSGTDTGSESGGSGTDQGSGGSGTDQGSGGSGSGGDGSLV